MQIVAEQFIVTLKILLILSSGQVFLFKSQGMGHEVSRFTENSKIIAALSK
jgi:hypothetical protein